MKVDMWTLMGLGTADIYKRWPSTRRFIDQGFVPDPRYHADNRIGLASLNQTIVLDLATGDLDHVCA